MSKEIEDVQFVSTCRKDEKIVRHVAKNGNMSNGNIRHVEATFDMLLRYVAGVDGALRIAQQALHWEVSGFRKVSGKDVDCKVLVFVGLRL